MIDNCRKLDYNEYIHRHNDVAGIIHQKIALNLNLLQERMPFYKYALVDVLEVENYHLYWDRIINADHAAVQNRLDIVVINKQLQYVQIIDVTVSIETTFKRAIRSRFRSIPSKVRNHEGVAIREKMHPFVI